MTVQSPPPYPPTTPAAPKSGMPWYAWVGIGCVVLLMLGIGSCFALGYFVKQKVGGYAEKFEKNPELAALELIIQANPDYEVVSTDEAAKRITIREVKTGKEATFDFEQIKSGNFSFETAEGTTNIDLSGGEGGGALTVTNEQGETTVLGASAEAKLPSWLTVYPGATNQGSFSVTGAEGGGMAGFQTTDSVDAVIDFYQKELQAQGLQADKSTYQVNGVTAGGTVTAKNAEGTREATIVVGGADGTTSISVTYRDQG
jgi:hypothetical protein